MKVTPWIFPSLAALVTGGWIVTQKQSAATLQREIVLITERINQLKSAETETRASADKPAKEKDKKIRWKELSGKMGNMHGGMRDMRAITHAQQMLMDMSADELCAELDEIAGLGLEDAARKQLENMIISALAQKDPKLVLTRFADAIGNEKSSGHWQLKIALSKWADTEPAAASAWLDAQIAAGKFESKSLDGKNPSLVRFEGALVNALFKNDPAAASARVLTLPEEQREDLFQQGSFYHLSEKNEADYAKLVRDTMPADKVGGILADTANGFAIQGSYERIDGFITHTHATADEKKSIVNEVMKSKLSEDGELAEMLDGARAWAGKHAPEIVDKATGEGLANTLCVVTFEKASELALQYNEKSNSDEVLVSFLKSTSVIHGKSKEQAKALIDKIKDPALQEEIRNLPAYKN